MRNAQGQYAPMLIDLELKAHRDFGSDAILVPMFFFELLCRPPAQQQTPMRCQPTASVSSPSFRDRNAAEHYSHDG